jgi:hypothetical protein
VAKDTAAVPKTNMHAIANNTNFLITKYPPVKFSFEVRSGQSSLAPSIFDYPEMKDMRPGLKPGCFDYRSF